MLVFLLSKESFSRDCNATAKNSSCLKFALAAARAHANH